MSFPKVKVNKFQLKKLWFFSSNNKHNILCCYFDIQNRGLNLKIGFSSCFYCKSLKRKTSATLVEAYKHQRNSYVSLISFSLKRGKKLPTKHEITLTDNLFLQLFSSGFLCWLIWVCLCEGLYTLDIFAHNIAIKIKRYCNKKIILSHWYLKANQGTLLTKHREPWFVVC